MNLQFWANKRVLITGHTGFKGAWLALWLNYLNAKVIGLSLDPVTVPNLYDTTRLKSIITTDLRADIRNFPSLITIIKEYQPEIIFHLAAQSLVRYSYENPVETYETNVMGTVNLLEVARLCPSVKVFINVTSDKCYENQEWTWGYRENDLLGGYDPYSNSKACSELITKVYQNLVKNDDKMQRIVFSTTRAGNVIGGGDWAKDRLIPDIMKSRVNNEPLKIRYPDAIRPWQHVLEPLQGYIRLAEKAYSKGDDYAEPWNFGPNEEDICSVDLIIKKIQGLTNSGLNISYLSENLPHETQCLKLDSTKSRSNLCWKPQWRLDQALEKTISWYDSYNAQENMLDFTLEQIKEYTNQIGRNA